MEGVLLRRPVLEGAGKYLDVRIGSYLAPGNCCEVLAELDAEDSKATTRERQRGLPRAATDLEYPSCWWYPRQGHHIVKEFVRIGGARFIVQRRYLIEGGP
jgi:hypothetical protein